MGETGVPEIDTRYLEPKHHLGRGAFGQVIKAMYRGEPVAMKVLENDSPACRRQFVNEMERLYTLRHPCIIKVIGKCTNTKFAFVMELMDNGSVEDLLHRHLHMNYKADHVFSWAKQCADAVAFIHNKKLVHRDLKPTNLLLKDRFRILKLCDFGTVSVVKTSMTNNQGTPTWMAPEVFTGKKYDNKCDVYSFGITLWEMITRKRPFDNETNSYTILWKAYEGKRPTVIEEPNCPQIVMDLITSCWDKDKNLRPTMQEVLEILTALTKIFPHGMDQLESSEHSPAAPAAPLPRILVENMSPPRISSQDGGVTPVIMEPGPQSSRSSNNENTMQAPRRISSEGRLEYLNRIDPSLRPIPPTKQREEDQNLYFDQVTACESLVRIEDQLQTAFQTKHKLLSKLRRLDETGRLLDRRDRLREILQDTYARIQAQRQIPPTPL